MSKPPAPVSAAVGGGGGPPRPTARPNRGAVSRGETSDAARRCTDGGRARFFHPVERPVPSAALAPRGVSDLRTSGKLSTLVQVRASLVALGGTGCRILS